MPEYNIGSSRVDFENQIRAAQRASSQIDSLNQAEERRRNAEERTTGVEGTAATVRSDLAEATERLATAIRTDTTALGLETRAIEGNTTALRANLELRRQITNTPIARAGVAETTAGRATGAAAAATVPVAAVDTQRLQAARQAVADAESAALLARAEVQRSSRRTGTTAGELAPLVQAREVANQRLQTAQTELRAAQQSAELEAQIAQAKQIQLAEIRQQNDALVRARAESIAYGAQTDPLASWRAGRAPSSARTSLPLRRARAGFRRGRVAAPQSAAASR